MSSLNANPVVFDVREEDDRRIWSPVANEEETEPLDVNEVFDIIRNINDPEHPYTLEQLNVTQRSLIAVDGSAVSVQFTPTIPHCEMATLIGLCLRVKLMRSLPARCKVDIRITPGTHAQEHQVNKQLNDKERVAAALEKPNLLAMVNQCLRSHQEH
ncbi:MAG: hypothetical protein MHM6MM_003010 [Cercozoa sp. M6MM]